MQIRWSQVECYVLSAVHNDKMEETEYYVKMCKERMRSLQHDKQRYALDMSRRRADDFKDALTEFRELGLSIEETLSGVT